MTGHWCAGAPYRGLFPSPPLFDRMPTYRTQGKRSLNFLSAELEQIEQAVDIYLGAIRALQPQATHA